MKIIGTLAASAAILALSFGSAQAEEVKKIGLAVANLQANFFNQIKQSVEAEAKKRGIEVVTVDAKGDGPTQVNQIQDLLTQNIDALIYIPAGVPHLPGNPYDETCVAVIARTDPNEQESVVLRPDLDDLIPITG